MPACILVDYTVTIVWNDRQMEFSEAPTHFRKTQPQIVRKPIGFPAYSPIQRQIANCKPSWGLNTPVYASHIICFRRHHKSHRSGKVGNSQSCGFPERKKLVFPTCTWNEELIQLMTRMTRTLLPGNTCMNILWIVRFNGKMDAVDGLDAPRLLNCGE